MTINIDHLSDDIKRQILLAPRGTLEGIAADLGYSYSSIRVWRSKNKHLLPNLDLDDDEPAADELETLRKFAELNAVNEPEDAGTYLVDEDLQEIITRVKSAPKSIVKSVGEHRRMARAYSNWSGAAASFDELSRDFGLPPQWFREYARAHGWQRSGPPFTKEELAERSIDDLAHEVDAMKEVALRRKVHELEWRRIKQKAAKFDTLDQQMMRYVDALPETYRAPELPQRPYTPAGFAVVMSTNDLHYGKLSAPLETGYRYNRDLARSRLVATTQDLLQRVLRFGQPERFFVLIGSDDEHVDSMLKTTTSGTPQDVDGSVVENALEYSQLLIDYLETIRRVGAPITIVAVPGNHNRLSAIYRAMEVAAFYRNVCSVEVQVTGAPRKYALFGTTLLGFSHGEEKLKDMPLLMATEAPTLWGQSSHRCFFVHHLHHESVTEAIGVKIYRAPSLSSADAWHTRSGYVSTPGAAAYIVDSGVSASLFANVEA